MPLIRITSYNVCYTKLLRKINSTNLPLIGIGVALSGIINPKDGIINQSYPLEIFEPFNFYDVVKDKTNIPILIENDANCGCYSELIQNLDRASDFIFIQSELRNVQAKKNDNLSLAIGTGIVITSYSIHYTKLYEYRFYPQILKRV